MPVAVAVFTRLPEPGRAKTRLIPVLGAAGAAELQRRLAEHAVAEAAAAACGPVTVWATPRIDAPWLVALADRHGAALALQEGADLGARMRGALAEGVRATGAALVMGSDLPDLRRDVLRRAAEALGGADAVLLPVEDGGYGLLGVRGAVPDLFSGIPWGGPEVAAATRRRAAALGLRVVELEPLWDLDRPADLARLDPGRFPLRAGAGAGGAPVPPRG
ncbi:TIGR04282 family arsenosugar biosynthesis glycosyltransferase [Inmirania thermothiophila]|uniref:Glycosyltransferase A (GT-A) superfamily protein (DUF2064 family) n=1 Tax=Inmirania thermothiophila TaxID=1750597 RepID=A0A3N1Y8N4_9GAMM|nr:TIGR04282 family arsenosugar biosynthesis glycosyltransferase [Inmirania thermothiophila]ROR34901.1 hypothetical protein EDC57_0812 [Inmirania thermothiophila]